ncbi:MAG: UvrD-helicase domain-containing protein, partial [Abitibacteriaceae bacterium]|nr:UvrD-helicase domain-containing protein [Abditibacteriaceae bacterium]
MSDQWTAIRQSARQVLDRYERCARKFGRPPAFTTERGSYAILKDIARVGLGEKYYVLHDHDIPNSVFSRLNLSAKSISVCAQLDAPKQAFVTAHAIGHLALHHAPTYLSNEKDNPLDLTDGEWVPQSVADIIEDGPAQINEQPHAGSLMGQHGPLGAYRDRERLELEANVFALELLAPLEKIRAKTTAGPDWTVEGLATYFGLSHETMRHQLVAALLICPCPDPLEKEKPADDFQSAAQSPFENLPAASSSSDNATELDNLPPFLSLDPQQRAAAEVAAPALVVAGPGAGKTRVLTARFVHLVQSGVAPNRILALTFSNKAAAEMQERLSAALPQHAPDIQVFTFHSLGLQLLSAYGSYLGYDKTPRVLSDSDAFVLLRSCLERLPLGQFHNLADPTQFLEPLLTRIGRLKDDLISPTDFRQRVASWHQQLQQQQPADPVAEVHHQEHLATASKCLDLAAIYETYQAWLQDRGYA